MATHGIDMIAPGVQKGLSPGASFHKGQNLGTHTGRVAIVTPTHAELWEQSLQRRVKIPDTYHRQHQKPFVQHHQEQEPAHLLGPIVRCMGSGTSQQANYQLASKASDSHPQRKDVSTATKFLTYNMAKLHANEGQFAPF